jgi:hypothetical protein
MKNQDSSSLEQRMQEKQNRRIHGKERKAGYGDKKLEGPNRPST